MKLAKAEQLLSTKWICEEMTRGFIDFPWAYLPEQPVAGDIWTNNKSSFLVLETTKKAHKAPYSHIPYWNLRILWDFGRIDEWSWDETCGEDSLKITRRGVSRVSEHGFQKMEL